MSASTQRRAKAATAPGKPSQSRNFPFSQTAAKLTGQSGTTVQGRRNDQRDRIIEQAGDLTRLSTTGGRVPVRPGFEQAPHRDSVTGISDYATIHRH